MEKNGDLSAYDLYGDLYASGTWEVHGENFKAHYSPIGENYTYTFTGIYDDFIEDISGSWKESPNSTNGGTFEMYKQ